MLLRGNLFRTQSHRQSRTPPSPRRRTRACRPVPRATLCRSRPRPWRNATECDRSALYRRSPSAPAGSPARYADAGQWRPAGSRSAAPVRKSTMQWLVGASGGTVFVCVCVLCVLYVREKIMGRRGKRLRKSSLDGTRYDNFEFQEIV